MIRKIAALLGSLILVGVMSAAVVSPAEASAPVSMRGPGPASDIYHDRVGNDQAIGVICSNPYGNGVWVKKGQFAWSKCFNQGYGTPIAVIMPANFRAWCSNLNAAPGTWSYLVPGGSTVSIWGNDIFKCYSQHYDN